MTPSLRPGTPSNIRDGRYKGVFDLEGETPWVAKVGDEIQIRVASASREPSSVADQWSFRTLIVMPDGTVARDEQNTDEFWVGAELIHSPDLGLLGIQGSVLDGFTPRAGKTTWRLDTKTHQYLRGDEFR